MKRIMIMNVFLGLVQGSNGKQDKSIYLFIRGFGSTYVHIDERCTSTRLPGAYITVRKENHAINNKRLFAVMHLAVRVCSYFNSLNEGEYEFKYTQYTNLFNISDFIAK